MKFVHASVVMMTALGGVDAVRGGMAPDYDFQWATIGAVGNEPWFGDPFFSPVNGRGRVDYEYRIAKTELSTGQYLEFINTFAPMTAQLAEDLRPASWGGVPDPNYAFGTRYRLQQGVPQADLVPLNGISWRAAAMYCNWLHNDKTPALWAIQSGAYDTSTFGELPDGTLTDQVTHSPDAKFWIPTLDEWTKAAHYDPHKNGLNQGGYWLYPTTSDAAPVSGRPGEIGAETAAGTPSDGDYVAEYVPIGSYSYVTSPWGLLDTSGGGSEFTEFWAVDSRLIRGSRAYVTQSPEIYDHIAQLQSVRAYSRAGTLRVVSIIPTPSGALGLVGCAFIYSSRRRRRVAWLSP